MTRTNLNNKRGERRGAQPVKEPQQKQEKARRSGLFDLSKEDREQMTEQ